MIKIQKIKETDWYLNEIKKLFVHGSTKSNFDDHFYKETEDINRELKEFGLSYNDFSEQKGRTLFEELIVASYADLQKIFKKIPSETKGLFWRLEKSEKGKTTRKYIGAWEKIYKTYDKFSKNNLNIMIIEKFNIKCCPYCNENFILNRDTKAMAQLDHFYPRNIYPIFALCLYNLIPTCYSCNHIKGSKLIGVSPHNQDYNFDALKISYIPLTADWINNSNEIDISFLYNYDSGGDLIEKNINEMSIAKSYKFHKEYVQELLKKAQIYNKEKIQEIKYSFPDLFSNEEEIFRIIFGNYIEGIDLGRRPLSKLTKDILEELKII
ncbi:hypothetical protein [Sedimentibacter sp. B4]|uniref:hypothetical protein n=1 Tax=Sedimentibacter sp. B4 TaxID=304766 RepID=UPI0002E98885|nr:hypothetical protein [Sedimentibacter sp. B4]